MHLHIHKLSLKLVSMYEIYAVFLAGPCADPLLAGGRLSDEMFIDGRPKHLLAPCSYI